LVLPFWYRLTWVVPEKEPLNGCVCVCVLTHLYSIVFLFRSFEYFFPGMIFIRCNIWTILLCMLRHYNVCLSVTF